MYFGYGTLSSSPISMAGFGRPNLQAIMIGRYTKTQMVISSNLPQVPLMVIYYLNTDILSRMLSAKNWTIYSRESKGLRVASPRSARRGTYLLSMPLRYGIPYLVLSIVIHWAIFRQFSELLLLSRKIKEGHSNLDNILSSSTKTQRFLSRASRRLQPRSPLLYSLCF